MDSPIPAQDMAALFGGPLQPDPSIALRSIAIKARITPGPIRNQQYVIELVGPRTVPSQSIKPLLESQWQAALGQPQVFVMAGSDSAWRRLASSDMSGSYDSVALSWDLLSEKGALTSVAAQHLFGLAENLARQIERRAMPMPVPADVDLQVKALEQIRSSLDIGVNLSVAAVRGPFPESEVWKACAALGLQYGPGGLFEWRVPGWDGPLLGVGPGELDQFSLGQVRQGILHQTLTVGFSIPLSPAPQAAFEASMHAGGVLAQGLQAQLLDDEDQPVTNRSKAQMASNLQQAVQALSKAGFEPGSTEALRLFS